MVQITQASMCQYMILQCDFHFCFFFYTFLICCRSDSHVVPPSYVRKVYVGGAVHLVAEVS